MSTTTTTNQSTVTKEPSNEEEKMIDRLLNQMTPQQVKTAIHSMIHELHTIYNQHETRRLNTEYKFPAWWYGKICPSTGRFRFQMSIATDKYRVYNIEASNTEAKSSWDTLVESKKMCKDVLIHVNGCKLHEHPTVLNRDWKVGDVDLWVDQVVHVDDYKTSMAEFYYAYCPQKIAAMKCEKEEKRCLKHHQPHKETCKECHNNDRPCCWHRVIYDGCEDCKRYFDFMNEWCSLSWHLKESIPIVEAFHAKLDKERLAGKK